MLRKLSRANSSVILVGVGIATAGIGDAVLLPVIVGGGFGATISGGFYAATCGKHCTTEGYISHTLSGGALGSLGGLAGPVSGAFGLEAGSGMAGGLIARGLGGSLSAVGQAILDLGSGKSVQDTEADSLIAGTFGLLGGGDLEGLKSTGSFIEDVSLVARQPKAMDTLVDAAGDIAGAAREAGLAPFF